MKYLQKQFSIFMGGSKEYEQNYEKIFKKSLKQKILKKIDALLYIVFLKGGNNDL